MYLDKSAETEIPFVSLNISELLALCLQGKKGGNFRVTATPVVQMVVIHMDIDPVFVTMVLQGLSFASSSIRGLITWFKKNKKADGDQKDVQEDPKN